MNGQNYCDYLLKTQDGWVPSIKDILKVNKNEDTEDILEANENENTENIHETNKNENIEERYTILSYMYQILSYG